MNSSLAVNEIFLSIQGESSFAGLPCVFVRLAGCNLRCAWCDTAYAFTEGSKLGLDAILTQVKELARHFPQPSPTKASRNPPLREGATGSEPGNLSPRLPLVEVTGGEPLLQPATLELLTTLAEAGFTVLLETSGALDISGVDARVHRILDLKCPGSGEETRNRWANLQHLKPTDEIKLVIASREDYDWAKEQVVTRQLACICPVLFSRAAPLEPEQRDTSLKPFPAAHHPITLTELAERIIADGLPVRLQVQLHKIVWDPLRRGV